MALVSVILNEARATLFAYRCSQLCRTIGTEKNGQAFKSIGVLVTSREALARVPTKRIAVFDHKPVLNQIDGKAVHLVDQRWKCQLVGLELDSTLSEC